MKPDSEEPKVVVNLEPMGRRIEVAVNTTLLQAAQDAGIDLMAVCGGVGTCGMCRVFPISGDFSPLTFIEECEFTQKEILSGIRLACCTNILSDCSVHFPPESLATLQRLQLEGHPSDIHIEPIVSRIEIDLSAGPVQDAAQLVAQVLESINQQQASIISIPERFQLQLTAILKANQYKASIVVNENEVISIIAPSSPMVGFAVDIGTTKIAGYLVDLETGQTLTSAGATNPQIAYGEDIISRIKYANEHDQGAEILQAVLVKTLNELLSQMCSQCEVVREQIVDSVMVGNTAMHHLLLGLPVHPLGTAPYQTPAVQPMSVPARDLGINIAESASIYLPPNIASFVGGDHVAVLLSTDARNRGITVLAVDIGTNSEISLIHNGQHFTCSCASGPAFEGAHIREGMRAIAGAIEKVYIDEGIPKIKTIENKPAIGICGSGILDTVAELRREKLIDERGSFNKNDVRMAMTGGKPAFVLVDEHKSGHGREITIDRSDINQIQLAKAAIRSGVEVLLANARMQSEQIDLVLLAGAFGTYLDVNSALQVGMFPRLPVERFQQVGNAAGSGARQMLLSKHKRCLAEQMTADIQYVELTTVDHYVDIFMKAIGFD